MRYNMTHKLSILLASSFIGFIGWIIYLANTGGSSPFFDLVHAMPYGDKIGHLLIFGTMTLLTNAASAWRCFTLKGYPLFYGTTVVALFALTEELSQGFVATRTLDIADLTADAIGIGLFTAISYWFRRQQALKKSGS